MGLNISKNSDMNGGSDTINWNNIKTEDMSSTIPKFTGISNDAKNLVENLTITESNNNTVSEVNFNNLLNDKAVDTNVFESKNDNTILSTESSPFISSEMYNYIVNKYKNVKNTNDMYDPNQISKIAMTGGAKTDDNPTSSTSSDSEGSSSSKSSKSSNSEGNTEGSSSSKSTGSEEKTESPTNSNETTESSSKSTESKVKEKKTKQNGGKKKWVKNSVVNRYQDYTNYLSSSAHTEESIQNENNYSVSSINTSEINFIH